MKKIRGMFLAKWLFRWNLSYSIFGTLFTALTFLGVFTLVLGPVLQKVGLAYWQTSVILFLSVVGLMLGVGIFLDRIMRFWHAQNVMIAHRNPFLNEFLYPKEILMMKFTDLIQLKALRHLANGGSLDVKELDDAIKTLENAIKNERFETK